MAPVEEGPQPCFVLTISLDDDKCNADGAWHMAGTMRNVRSPSECPHFGTAYEMFHQFEVEGIGPKYDDFQPRPEKDPVDGETKVVRRWFDKLVFNGTNAEKQRDGRAPADYSTFRRACKKMHESTKPPMNQEGVALHMERGVSARDKEYHGLRPEQSKKAGRWKTGRGAHETNYANGLSYDFMRLACGLPSTHPGHFNPLRAILPVPPALKAQVFTSLRPLRADIVSGVFPSQDVDETLEGFVEMVD